MKSLLIGTSAALMAVAACKTAPQETLEKPNIVYIMTDDHSFQTISAYGGTLINNSKK